ncbi:HK97 family phage prohead protease [Psychrobacter faecalis]|uniref:HK97 family phage prohead protease n=1 Tax=Psychrobacter faecalis TaxID=180588 RepID=UPI0018DF576F|nr:HK97 family phage prohead protease [Psychrobacter faecalis]
MTKAYSTLKVKEISEDGDTRTITGIASTPKQDRDNDIMDMEGAQFALPMPLLWQHKHNEPIGEVTAATVTSDGIEITATIVKIEDDGPLKNRIDEAWQSIKSGLVKGLSIGFRLLEYQYLDDSYGLHIKEWEWYELSAVTIPANPDGKITSVKNIKQAFLDAQNPIDTPPKSMADTTTPKSVKTAPLANHEPAAQKPKTITLVDPNRGSIPLIKIGEPL